MKSFKLSLIALAFSFASVQAQTIEGIWWSPKKDGKIKVYSTPNGNYEGKLIWTSNPSPHNQAMVGVLIIKNLVKEGENSFKGNVYDPQINETYDCTVSLADDNTLNLHGYAGISLLGKTEQFTRVTD